MGAAKQLDKQINQYLPLLNDRQKETVLTVVKSFVEEEEARWTDKEYQSEMERRFSELERGKVKGITLEDLESRARQSYKNRKRKKE